MNIDIRLNSSYDSDLLALVDNGYSVQIMMEQAIINYARGIDFKIILDKPYPYKEREEKIKHFTFTIADSDTDTIALLRSVQKRKLTKFCKSCLRNAFLCQNLGVYLTDEAADIFQTQNIRASIEKKGDNRLMIPISEYRNKKMTKAAIYAQLLPSVLQYQKRN